MKAIVYKKYGPPDVLQPEEVDKPEPKDNEIRIKINATPVNFGDLMVRNMKRITPRKFTMPLPLWLPVRLMLGFGKPKKQILGSEFAGEIDAVGKAVKRFKTGDPVFGYRGMNLMANAEYLCMPESGCVAIKPANMTDEEAACIPYGGLTASSLLGKVNIQAGQKVLVNGASGGIGSFAVQFAKNAGAHVTGVCGTARIEYVKALGADKVIDYTKEDFTRNGQTYDLIFDILRKSSFSRCKRSLNKNGRYLLASFRLVHLFQMLWTKISSFKSGKRVICALAPEKAEDLVRVKELVETGKIKPIIDKRFPLEQTAEAHRYIESGLKKGHVVIIL